LGNIRKISYAKATDMTKKTEGYKTDLNGKDTFNPGLLELDKKVRKIKFRFYKGVKGFTWSDWYDIE
jgi:hypothetical protein